MSMTKKKIVLEDGRYLIYFNFDEKKPAKQEDKSAAKCCSCKGDK